MRKLYALLVAFVLSSLVVGCGSTGSGIPPSATEPSAVEMQSIEPITEPAAEPIPEPVIEPEPVAEAVAEPIVEPITEPIPEAEPEIMEEVIVQWVDVNDPESAYINPDYDPNPAPVEEPVTDMVWIPHSGSKYHSSSSCSGMKGPSQVSLADAQRRGYDPCKKCH